ncbi:LuxR C-terminal-related transcriptional regulator [Streptomyces atrovirens]|uniref:ATP-binding protein n=1 Tax=Streptomyces atrovirens TaxID=285556 RepID=A0ABW0DX29_9ACTN
MAMGYAQTRCGLPSAVTSFVGRSVELGHVRRLLNDARLVTLTGPGGVGKSRIALRVASDLAAEYPEGVCLAELSGLHQGDLLPQSLADLLGIRDLGTGDPLDAVVAHLRGRRMLLVLDTCEHLVDSCALFADLVLRETPDVRLLATSRQPLDVPGEHTVAVPPLNVESGDAAELFAQRAAAVVPGFQVTDDNRDDVRALCRRLDGIPLAIELATVRLRAIPLEQLAARLEDRFRVLTGGRRTALPRHQTLRTTIGWSHELCSPEERLVWSRLSVFAGTFDLTAAERVTAGGDIYEEEVVEHLISLVDKSIVLRVDDPSGSGTRYRLLDTMREYGAEWLERVDEEDTTRDRHLAHYTDLAAHFHRAAYTDRQVGLVHALARDWANVRTALERSHDRGHAAPVDALRLTLCLVPYWLCTSRFSEARLWLERGLELVTDPVPERAEALAHYAHFSFVQGDRTVGEEANRQSLDLANGLGDDRLRGYALQIVGLGHMLAGQDVTADAHYAEARELLLPSGYELGIGFVHMHDAMIAGFTGDSRRALAAERAYQEAFGSTGESFYRSFIQEFIGLALWVEGRHAECGPVIRRAVRLKAGQDEADGIATCLEILAWEAAVANRPVRAAWLLGAADAYFRAGDVVLMWSRPSLAQTHEQIMGQVSGQLGQARFSELFRQGAELDEDLAVALAAEDAEEPTPEQPAGPGAATGVDTLTKREREVAELITKGMSNREIAEQLVISKRTADSHVEHILDKLAVSRRGQIAAVLHAAPAGSPGRPAPADDSPSAALSSNNL